MKFTEEKLEQAFIELIAQEEITHVFGETIQRNSEDVLLKDDLKAYLQNRYKEEDITLAEIDSVIRELEKYPASDLYESNKAIMKIISDGFILKREDRSKKDLYIQLIDYRDLGSYIQPSPENLTRIVAEDKTAYKTDPNIYKIVNQFEIQGFERRIPDAIVYINGLPLVVLEFKSAIRENATIYNAFVQITVRYKRDIPELFKYNAFCVISDGVNNKAGSFFAPYEYFYAWRKTDGSELVEVDGIDSLYSMIQGLFQATRLIDVIRNFVYLPDTS